MRWEGQDREGETPAAMLRVLDKPAVSWELALRPGQDARLLGAGEFYGFGVDTATACFVDASARDTLAKLYEQQQTEGSRGEPDVHSCTVSDPLSGANLIAYPSGRGDGSYLVWIGRDAEGAVTCLVADMLVLHDADADALPPTAHPATCLSPFPPHVDDRRDAPLHQPRFHQRVHRPPDRRHRGVRGRAPATPPELTAPIGIRPTTGARAKVAPGRRCQATSSAMLRAVSHRPRSRESVTTSCSWCCPSQLRRAFSRAFATEGARTTYISMTMRLSVASRQ